MAAHSFKTMLPTSALCELYAQGLSLRQIAAEAGITVQAVHDLLEIEPAAPGH